MPTRWRIVAWAVACDDLSGRSRCAEIGGPFRSRGEAASMARHQGRKGSCFGCWRTEYGKAPRHGHRVVKLVEAPGLARRRGTR